MIKIYREAIDSTLEETVNAHRDGRLIAFQLDVERRINQKQPFLADYIYDGLEQLKFAGGNELIQGGYRSGAHLTFRIIETQLKINQRQSSIF